MIDASLRKLDPMRNEKGLPEFDWVQEEEYYDHYKNGEIGFIRRCQRFIAFFLFAWLLAVFCFMIWDFSRPHRPRIAVESVTVNYFHFSVGPDYSGVLTTLLTVNCSVKMCVYNPATFFGIHVSSTPVHLFFSEIKVATGEVGRYYQPRKSQSIVSVNLKGKLVPIYGAGENVAGHRDSGGVPFRLEVGIRSQGYEVGKSMKAKHQSYVACVLVIDSSNTKLIKFKDDSCTYG